MYHKENTDHTAIDLRQLLSIILKRLWIIVLLTVVTTVTAACISLFYLTPIYEAKALLLVNNTQPNKITMVRDVERDLKLVDTYAELMKSRSVMTQAIIQMKSKMSPQQLTNKVTVNRLNTSQLISITVMDQRHEEAVRIVNTLAEVSQKQVNGLMKEDNLHIIELAYVEDHPIPAKPKPLINTLIGLLVGLLAGVAICLLLEYWDDTINAAGDIEKTTGLPVLAVIPKIKSLNKQSDNPTIDVYNRFARDEIATGLEQELSRKRKYAKTVKKKKQMNTDVIEVYRTLCNHLQFGIGSKVRTILVTNPGPGKGKPITVINLAASLAQNGKQVLLLDADFRNPKVHDFFRISNDVGFINLLQSGSHQGIVQNTFIEGLSVIPAGTAPDHNKEPFGSQQLEAFFREMAIAFDYILIDAPPLMSVADAQVLATSVDGVLIVVQAGKANKEILLKAKSLLDHVHANIIGLVLNHPKIKGYRYYHN
ncbi:capsular exopolysaccharide synthesis family protein [Aneurinibacillus soli]|uniref:non-specific protein-tyrosine kinase n=2 Tax=Aneurinibacillus soli TaxID=1500254 RepID=A0A0U5AWG7_9BACL|nr:polysaccharide biosynthesis tyrosine autokinase [Aneurinibacillus soli]PYE64141.1 capsular exopolysaccharide synthesis family protein [Aneurinibacillus soli]BAU28090.1 Tyrosine-protein kinase YwqD [Aneurinibacillus soli]